MGQTVAGRLLEETGAAAVVFTRARQEASVEALLQLCLARIKRNRSRVDANKMIVVGMPNVGKSTLINAFKRSIGAVAEKRDNALDVGLSSSALSSSVQKLQEWARKNGGKKGTALPFTLMDTNDHSNTRVTKKKKRQELVKTGPLPGVTKDVNAFWVSRDPALLCVDSPGMLLPKMTDAEKMLKLAAVGVRKPLGRSLSSLPPSLTLYGSFYLFLLSVYRNLFFISLFLSPSHTLSSYLTRCPVLLSCLTRLQCIRDSLVGEFLIADYLLYKLREEDNSQVARVYNMPVQSLAEVDVDALLEYIATDRRLRGDSASVTLHAARLFLSHFRDGTLGKSCLDDINT